METTFIGQDHVKCRAPPHRNSLASIETVHGSGLDETFSGFFFSYTEALLMSVSPSSGPRRGGTYVKVYGENMPPFSSCTFDGAARVTAVYASSSLIVCVTTRRRHPGPSLLQIMSFDAVLQGHAFFYFEEPIAIKDVLPTWGPRRGGTEIMVSGSGACLLPHLRLHSMTRVVALYSIAC